VKRAVELEEETLRRKQSVLGDRHRETLSSMVNLAAYLNQLSRFEDAEALYRKIVAFTPETISEDDPVFLTSLNNLAYSLREQGELEEAESLYRTVLETRTRVLGDRHPSTLFTLANLGVLLRQRGKLEETLEVHREAVALKLEVLGREHFETLNSMNHLAQTLCDLEEHAEAKDLFQDVLSRGKKLFPDDWRISVFETHFGECLILMSRHEEAEPLLLESYSKLDSALGPEHQRTQNALRALVKLYEATGEKTAASRFRALLED
jgi:tetratricopeptide (TPR) repeat protein